MAGQQVAGGSATFTMDAAGNILVKSQEGGQPMTMSYDAASRLVTMLQVTSLTTCTYDSKGSMTREESAFGTTTYSYDRESRLEVLDVSGARSTFAYDGDGLRRVARSASGTTTFVWNGSDYLGELK